MRTKKRPVLGAFSGLFFGLSLAVLLLGFGVVQLDSAVLTVLPVAFIFLGVLGALIAPRTPKQKPVAKTAAPDISEWVDTPAATPPPPPGDPTPPPAEAPQFTGSAEAPAGGAPGDSDTKEP